MAGINALKIKSITTLTVDSEMPAPEISLLPKASRCGDSAIEVRHNAVTPHPCSAQHRGKIAALD
jgi:hypothetical protein